MGESPQEAIYNRLACTNCQRRKQKCNRKWPCNRCQKRRMAEKCHFGHEQPSPNKTSSQYSTWKRKPNDEDFAESSGSSLWNKGDCGLAALGYMPSHIFASLGSSSAVDKPFLTDTSSCPQLNSALQVLPTRPFVDSLVQNFFSNVNFHYSIIYPPSFLEDYVTWWSLLLENRPVGLQWTCLLLMVCACSVQYADIELQLKLQVELGQSTRRLSEQYHNAARELHSFIPVGNTHGLNVQSLLHSCYWYMSEGRFVECWHVLSAAVREAQELGFHQETATGYRAEFDREMRRRVWCVLDIWDWQISALLSRPMIIDRTDCDVGVPSLTMENYEPSPLLHLKLQGELIRQLSSRFGIPRNVLETADVQAYQAILDRWMSTLPSSYDLTQPDKSSDVARPWIVLHRHYLHIMAYSMVLYPFRAYLAKPMSKESSLVELKIRSDGVNYSLKLMDALHGFFDHLYPQDAKFRFVLFYIFDTAALLCLAVIHDQDNSIPKRFEIVAEVDKALAMLKHQSKTSKTTKTSYNVLIKVAQRINRTTLTAKAPSKSVRRKRKHPAKSQVETLRASVPVRLELQTSLYLSGSDLLDHTILPLQPTPAGSCLKSDEPVMNVLPGTVAPGFSGLDLPDPSNKMHMNGAAAINHQKSYISVKPLPNDDFSPATDVDAIKEEDAGYILGKQLYLYECFCSHDEQAFAPWYQHGCS